jgi:hypothetical protein
MLQKTRYRALLLVALTSLGGSLFLTGCASSPFAMFYDPASNRHSTPVTSHATPVLIQSRYPDVDAKQLAREGYALIGTSQFVTGQLATGPLEDSFYRNQAVAEGTKVGAAIVLLHVDYTSELADGCCASVFASYWADSALPRGYGAR